MNFCRPNNRIKDSRCFTAYCKWVNSFDLSRGLPHILQRKYAHQLQSKKIFTDFICHYCGTKEKKRKKNTTHENTASTLIKVPTGSYDTHRPLLDSLGYQMFCRDTRCLKQYIESIECLQLGKKHTRPYIMNHIKFVL